MSRRRRNRQAAMTLFAFQDIIMSTSGIVIMMVLLLTLELVRRDGEPVAPETADSTPVESRLAATEKRIDELKSQLKSSDELVRVAAQVSTAELTVQIADLEKRNGQLREKVDALARNWRAMEQTAGQFSVQRSAAKELQQILEQQQRRKQQLEAEIAAVVQQDRPIYALSHGAQHSGWLATVTAEEIQIAPLGRPAVPTTFRQGGGLFNTSGPGRAFLKWSKQHSLPDDYYYFVVSPSGVDVFERITRDFDDRQIRYGFDVAQANATVLDPQRGAVP